jgi:hypothetical protein
MAAFPAPAPGKGAGFDDEVPYNVVRIACSQLLDRSPF